MKTQYEEEISQLKASNQLEESPKMERGYSEENSEENSEGSTPRMDSVTSVTPPGEVEELTRTVIVEEEVHKEVQIEELQHELDLYKLQMESYERETEEKHLADLEAKTVTLKEEFSKLIEELKNQHSLQVLELEKQLNELKYEMDNDSLDDVPMATIEESEQESLVATEAQGLTTGVHHDSMREDVDHLKELLEDKDKEVEEVKREITERHDKYVEELMEEKDKEVEEMKRAITERHDKYIEELMDELGTEHADELEKLRLEVMQEKHEDQGQVCSELEEKHRVQLEEVKTELEARNVEELENLKNELNGQHEMEKTQMMENFGERIECELGKLREELDSLMMREIEAATDHQKQAMESELSAKWEEWKAQYLEKVNNEKAWMRQEHEVKMAELETELKEQRGTAESIHNTHKEELESQREELEKKCEAEKQELIMQISQSSDVQSDVIAQYQAKVNDLENRCGDQQQQSEELSKLESEKEEYVNKVELCEAEIKELTQNIATKEEAFQEHISEIDKLKQLLDELQNVHREQTQEQRSQIVALERELATYYSSVSAEESCELDNHVSQLQAMIHDYEIKLEERENSLTQLAKEQEARFTEQENGHQETISDLHNKIAELTAIAQDLENKEVENRELQRSLEEKVMQLQEELDARKVDTDKEETDKKDIKEVEEANQERQDVTAELAALKPGMVLCL